MIYIIDEDIIQMSSLKTEFETRGYSTDIIPNADDAWTKLTSINESSIELVICDIMLAAKAPSKSRYDRDITQDYTITGICLAEDLLSFNLKLFNDKIVYLSHTNEEGIIAMIQNSSRHNNIPYIRKHDFFSDVNLADNILSIINLPLEKKV